MITRLRNGLIRRGVPPSWFGYRWVQEETVEDYLARNELLNEDGRYEIIHPEAVANNPLPRNISSRDELPSDRGWWGYSFRDVPSRRSGETFIATLQDCSIVPYIDEKKQFWVGILNADHRQLDLREFHFREGHAGVMRSSRPPARIPQATWIIERVYHNYSHWHTAHLPKLLLLKERDMLDDVLLPPKRPAFIDASLRMVGLDPDAFSTFDPTRPLQVDELTLLNTDRFRPELLRMVRQAMPQLTSEAPHRKIYISRQKAARRRLLNEDAIWPELERAGFERVFMEELPFETQVKLMQETAIMFAPHGAGLTNIMFCSEGAHVVEIADLSFPNPNFYAVASAMGHSYWILSAEGMGDVHPLDKDLRIQPKRVEEILGQLE